MQHPINVILGLLFYLSIFSPSQAWAIPSPDLVVNMFGSAAQLLALFSVVSGAGFMKLRKDGKSKGNAKKWRLFFMISILLLVGSVATNILQYTYNVDQKSNRLQTNLWRSSKEKGMQVGDTSLKTLAFSDQLQHPSGLSTETLNEWLKQQKPINIIDVRETEEFEMGYVPGAKNSRYPETRQNYDKLFEKGKENILMCFSGNRSSELCTEFVKLGISCRFIIGGYEKYIAEGHTLVGVTKSKNDRLRGLPDYPNKTAPLDTPDVIDTLKEGGAQFVDVRYPEDFKRYHLPGATNIPIRKLTNNELEIALSTLPDKPIIAPCYDKRSCFYAQILGLKVSRLGYDFLGRYTVPHEFALPSKESTHVAQWRKMQESKTFFDIAISPLRASLQWLENKTGHLAGAIILITIILRLIVLPISLKSERDTVVQRRLKQQIVAIKSRWEENHRRLSKELKRLYQKNRLTPGLNFTGTSFQMLLFIMFFSAVNTISNNSGDKFFWAHLSQPDPFFLFPVIVCLLFFAHIFFSSTNHKPLFIALYTFIAGGLFILTAPINAGVNLYLTFSLLFLVLQNRITYFIVNRSYEKLSKCFQETIPDNAGVVMLKDANRVSSTGNKAARLADMIEAGLPVPKGFVVTNNLLSQVDESDFLQLNDDDKRQIKKAFWQLEAKKVAVRSSGLSEDGAEQSYAGVFESLLNVKKKDLFDSLNAVAQSFSNDRAETYANGDEKEQGGIVVQKMVKAEYAGVMFTEHPASSGCMLIELVAGLGEKLVSGTATPKSYRFGRITGRPVGSEVPPIDLEPLVALGLEVKKLFGRPQDIEWAYSNGKFYLLQARDITAPITARQTPQATIERERKRILEVLVKERNSTEENLLIQNELAELLPKPTPLSLSLMDALWEIDGTTDIACRKLGIPYDVYDDSQPYIVKAFGNLYVNRSEIKRRLKDSPGAFTSFKLARAADDIEQSFMEDFLPHFTKEMRLREALDFGYFQTQELIILFSQWIHEFVNKTYVHAELINIAADIYLKTAERLLGKKGYDPVKYLGHGPETVMHRAMSLLTEISNGNRDLIDFLDLFGHRAVHDYELSEPRYQESDALIKKLLKRSSTGPIVESTLTLVPKGRLLRLSVKRAQKFQTLKEDAKHHSMRALSSLRKILLELDKRWNLEGKIFYLTIKEIMQIRGPLPNSYSKIIDDRFQEAKIFDDLKLPTELSIFELEQMEFDDSGRSLSSAIRKGSLQGICVSGDKEIVSSVRIVNDPDEFDDFQQGEIIVARFTDPSWVPLFPKAAGLVTEVGGWLSHSTIVAREYGLPCIVGAQGVLDQLENGQRVRIRADGMVDRRVNKSRRKSQASPFTYKLAKERREVERRKSYRHQDDRRLQEERRKTERRLPVANA